MQLQLVAGAAELAFVAAAGFALSAVAEPGESDVVRSVDDAYFVLRACSGRVSGSC